MSPHRQAALTAGVDIRKAACSRCGEPCYLCADCHRVAHREGVKP